MGRAFQKESSFLTTNFSGANMVSFRVPGIFFAGVGLILSCSRSLTRTLQPKQNTYNFGMTPSLDASDHQDYYMFRIGDSVFNLHFPLLQGAISNM